VDYDYLYNEVSSCSDELHPYTPCIDGQAMTVCTKSQVI
jgi:hypothetical protein